MKTKFRATTWLVLSTILMAFASFLGVPAFVLSMIAYTANAQKTEEGDKKVKKLKPWIYISFFTALAIVIIISCILLCHLLQAAKIL